jgi:hypothetical protein
MSSTYRKMTKKWAYRSKDSEKNLSQCHFVQHKSHMACPWIEPGLYGERIDKPELK